MKKLRGIITGLVVTLALAGGAYMGGAALHTADVYAAESSVDSNATEDSNDGIAVLAANVTASGNCGQNGANVNWTMYDDGKLVISGNGAMADYGTVYRTTPYRGESASVASASLADGYGMRTTAPWYDCVIKKIVVENGVTAIGKYAFACCWDLKTVSIAKSVTSIREGAFDSSSVKTIKFSNGLKSIGISAFNGCSGLTVVKLPKTVKTIGGWAFNLCVSLKKVVLPKGLKTIGKNAFMETQLAHVTIPKSVTSIGSDAFGSNLITAVVPKTVKGIKSGAFSYETKICRDANVTVKNGVNGIKVTWSKNKDATSYKVYRVAVNSGYFSSAVKCVASVKKNVTSYADKTAKSGKRYYYYVMAYNKNTMNESYSSSDEIVRLKTPSISVAKKSSGIKVSWKKVTGATGYIVSRKAEGSSKWTRIKLVKNVSSSTKNFSFIDKGAKKGKKYTYRISAYRYDSTYGESYFSGVKVSKSVKR